VQHRLALVLALGSLTFGAPLARAQRIGFGAPTPASPAAVGGADWVRLAGPRARARYDDEGRIRLLYGARIAPLFGDPARDAVALVHRFGDALGIGPGTDLRVESVQRWHGMTIVRLRRFVGDRRVLGASVTVRSLADGTIDLVLSAPGPARVERADPTVDAARAEALARSMPLPFAVARASRAVPEAIALPDVIVPLWRIDLEGAAESQRVRVWIDVHRGRVLAAMPLAIDVLGRVYATNPVSSRGETVLVPLVDLVSPKRLTGTNFHVASCNAQPGGGCAAVQHAVADEDGNFLFDPDARAFDDPFAEVNAYHHLSVAATHFRERHGFRGACPTVMRVLVNYTEAPETPYNNAAYSPSSSGCGFLLFGQGTGVDFAYDADVVYHEYGHVVTDQLTAITGFLADPLGVSYEPLAVNEGTSDYYAATIQGNPEIAESFSGLGGLGGHGSLRVIENELTCPASLFGEGHFDGRIWGGVGWDLRGEVGVEKADALVFTTVATMRDNPSLAEAGELLVATAMGMEAMGALTPSDVAAVQAEVEARGLPSCRRIVALDDGATRMGWSGSEGLTGGIGRSIAPIHYRIDVPVDATAVHLSVGRLTFTGRYQVHARAGMPVRVNVVRVFADAAFVPDESGRVTIDESSLPAGLPRCGTLYLAIEATDLTTSGQSVYTIRASVERTGDPDARCPLAPADAGVRGDAGASDAGPAFEPRGGGCACRSAGSAPGAGGGALPLGALGALGWALRPRRRR
jgi:hypothetical protein